MQIIYIKQKSTKQRGFWQPTLIMNDDGTVTLLPCVFYFRDIKIVIPEETWTPEEGDRVYIENYPDPLHLIRQSDGVSLTGEIIEDEYTPLSGDKKTSPGAVIWVEQDIIYILTHKEESNEDNEAIF